MRIALLFAVVLAAATPALGQVLTLDEARRRALESQPALRAMDMTSRAAEHAAVAEGALPDPKLKFGLLNLPARNFPGATWEDMTQFVVSYEQMLPGGEKRRLRESRTLAEAGQAKAEAGGQRQTIRRDVAFAWLDAWQAQAAERALRELGAEADRAIEVAQIAVGSGRGQQAEVYAARQLRGQFADRGMEISALLEKARASLRRWVPDAAKFELPAELPHWGEPAPRALIAEKLAQHPQQAIYESALGVANADVALAREASAPDKTFEIGYGARTGNRSDMLMFQVGFELPMFRERKQDRQLEAKLRMAERVRDQRADQLQMLRAELDAAWSEWSIAGERLRNFERNVLPAARGRLETLIVAQGSGRAELSQVLEARRQLIEARLQEIALRAARGKARAAVEYFEHADGERK